MGLIELAGRVARARAALAFARTLALGAMACSTAANAGWKRVPASPADPTHTEENWVERRADRRACVEGARIRGAEVLDPRTIELRLSRGERVRLRFAEACPQLSYYGGFYVSSGDSRLCAGRDELKGRAGGACAIESVIPLAPRRHPR